MIIDWGMEGQQTTLVTTGTPIRQQILDALAIRLAGIQVANGYNTDLGLHVYEWDTTPLDPNKETLDIQYRDDDETLEVTIGEHIMTLPVELRIRTDGSTALADMREMIADVITAIGTDVTFGGLAQDATPPATWTLVKGQAADTVAGASAKLPIIYTTTPWNPYTP